MIGGNKRVVRMVVRKKVMGVPEKKKGGKATGMDTIVAEMLKKGGISLHCSAVQKGRGQERM